MSNKMLSIFNSDCVRGNNIVFGEMAKWKCLGIRILYFRKSCDWRFIIIFFFHSSNVRNAFSALYILHAINTNWILIISSDWHLSNVRLIFNWFVFIDSSNVRSTISSRWTALLAYNTRKTAARLNWKL